MWWAINLIWLVLSLIAVWGFVTAEPDPDDKEVIDLEIPADDAMRQDAGRRHVQPPPPKSRQTTLRQGR